VNSSTAQITPHGTRSAAGASPKSTPWPSAAKTTLRWTASRARRTVSASKTASAAPRIATFVACPGIP
jgi:hypothetical protein